MIYSFENQTPRIHKNTFIAESADVIGNVTIGEDVNVWFGTVIRGDVHSITIGKGTNIQDNSTVHVTTDKASTTVGEYVTVGHNVILHGCTVGNYTLVGMGSIILDDAEIGEYSIVGAGSLVTKNTKIPSGVLCVGSPAKVVRQLTDEEKESLKESAEHYITLSKKYIK